MVERRTLTVNAGGTPDPETAVPVINLRKPLLPALVDPVVSVTEPLRPISEPDAAVAMARLPLLRSTPRPVAMQTLPPASRAEPPASIETRPAESDKHADPTNKRHEPPPPSSAAPVPRYRDLYSKVSISHDYKSALTHPASPVIVVPVTRSRAPLSPSLPASDVRSTRLPLPDEVPGPVVIFT